MKTGGRVHETLKFMRKHDSYTVRAGEENAPALLYTQIQ